MELKVSYCSELPLIGRLSHINELKAEVNIC
jgi:hypothetical protein